MMSRRGRRRFQLVVKRLLDLLACLIGLPVVAPLLLVIIVAVFYAASFIFLNLAQKRARAS